jgi:hypothetical protein
MLDGRLDQKLENRFGSARTTRETKAGNKSRNIKRWEKRQNRNRQDQQQQSGRYDVVEEEAGK